MSKLIEKLKQVSQPPSQPIGFKTASSESRLKIQLIANLSGSNIADISTRIVGCDALLLSLSDFEVKKIKKAATEITMPWGTWLTDSSKEDINQMGELGSDFIVFPTSASLLTTQSEKTGKIMQIEPSINDWLLRAINELPVDAVLLAGVEKEGTSITWQNLMLFQRFTVLLNKPLLVEVPTSITGKELQLIWETGVNGIVVSVDGDKTESVFPNLRQIIDNLSFPSKKKREKTAVTLPRVESKEPEPEEDEEEDE